MIKRVAVSCCVVGMVAASCSQSPRPCSESPRRAAVDTTDAIGALRDADQAWARSTDAESFLSFFAEDAIWLYADRPMMTGKEEMRAFVSPLFSRPRFTLGWRATRIKAGPSGDMGYTAGNWQSSYGDPEGRLVHNVGSYLAIWTKQRDGRWKVAAEVDFPGRELLPSPEPVLR